jgi:hypothetical protein
LFILRFPLLCVSYVLANLIHSDLKKFLVKLIAPVLKLHCYSTVQKVHTAAATLHYLVTVSQYVYQNAAMLPRSLSMPPHTHTLVLRPTSFCAHSKDVPTLL